MLATFHRKQLPEFPSPGPGQVHDADLGFAVVKTEADRLPFVSVPVVAGRPRHGHPVPSVPALKRRAFVRPPCDISSPRYPRSGHLLSSHSKPEH